MTIGLKTYVFYVQTVIVKLLLTVEETQERKEDCLLLGHVLCVVIKKIDKQMYVVDAINCGVEKQNLACLRRKNHKSLIDDQ